MINTVRVSKTSFKRWKLYGPMEQALKTSCQAETLRVIPIHIGAVHGQSRDVELWVNAEAPDASLESPDELNPYAQLILQQIELRKQGLSAEQLIASGAGLPEIPVIKGVAILTGAGASDFPEEHLICLLGALVGAHEEEHS